MPGESIAAEWKSIKKDFEEHFGKKPSPKILGIFRGGTGIGGAAEKLDAAIAKEDGAAATKAFETFRKACTDYQKTLADAAKTAEKGSKEAAAHTYFGTLLKPLLAGAEKDVEAVAEAGNMAEAKLSSWKGIIADCAASKVTAHAAVRAFATDKRFQTTVASPAVVPVLAKCQTDFTNKAKAFNTSMGKVKAFKPDLKNEVASAKSFLDALHETQDHLGLNAGAMHYLGEWRLQIQGTPDKGAAYANSELKGIMDAANEALSAENERMGKLEITFERQVQKVKGR